MDDGTKYPLLQFFRFEHLPAELQDVSRMFWQVADQMVGYHTATEHPAEVAAGLRKLLEAKDCFVRAALPKVPIR